MGKREGNVRKEGGKGKENGKGGISHMIISKSRRL